MQVLTTCEVDFVSGGQSDHYERPGSLSRPTRGESEWGKRFNDVAGALNSFGGWLGRTIYDLIN